MTARSAIDSYFQAILEAQRLLGDATISALERNRRLSSSTLSDMQRQGQELIGVGRALTDGSREQGRLSRVSREYAERSRERAIARRDEWRAAIGEARDETIELAERMETERRRTEDATVAYIGELLDSVITAAQTNLRRVGESQPRDTAGTVLVPDHLAQAPASNEAAGDRPKANAAQRQAQRSKSATPA